MITILRYVLNLFVRAFYSLAPRLVCKAIPAQVEYLDPLAYEKRTRQIGCEPVFKDRAIDSVERIPDNETELILRLMDSFNSAKQKQLSVPNVYLPNQDWKRLLATEWDHYYDGLSRKDISIVAPFLRNFFRNEGISGFWGNTKMFEAFCNLVGIAARRRKQMMQKQFEVWRTASPNTSLDELDAPKIGNPWGYSLAGILLFEPVFEYHFQANYFRRLLCEIETPVVLEIGGGFGGLGFYLLRRGGPIKYIGLDLPENILLQTYYLSCAFPGASILTYSKNFSRLDRTTISNYDIILLPNFVLPDIESSTADIIINIRSLSEMASETIAEYIHQIDRIGRLFFFHENIFAPRQDKLWGIPSSEFPALDNFILIAASESRWPKYKLGTAYPCQENLHIHRHAIRAPTSSTGRCSGD